MMTSPVSILVLALAWAALTFALWSRRRWLIYYITGAFGFILIALFSSQVMGWDSLLEATQAYEVVSIAGALGMNVDLLGNSGLAIENHVGWAVFDVGVECSAILEMAAFVGLIGFYPAFSATRRIVTIVVGVVATYLLNIARILLIVAIIDAGGTQWVFSAHAIFGRVLFFIGVIIIFWYLVTRPTVRIVSDRIKAVDA